MVFIVTTFAFMPLSLLGQRTFGAVDILETWSPYMEALDQPPEISSAIQGDQVEALPRPTAFYDDLRAGRFTLWEPAVAAGTPDGVLPFDSLLSPLSWSHLVLPAWYATSLRVAIALFVCQLGLYLFLRRLGRSPGAAVVAAVAFTFTGANIAALHRYMAIFVLPLLLWAADRLLERITTERVATTALMVAWCWLEGFPSTFVYVVLVAAAWVLAGLIGRYREDRRAADPLPTRRLAIRLGVFAATLALGMSVAAVNLVPFIDHLGDTSTRQERTYDADDHLPSVEVLGLVDTEVYGDAGPDGARLTGTNAVEGTTTVGTVTLALALATSVLALLGRWRGDRLATRTVAFWSWVVSVTVVLVYLGGPLLAAAYRIPGVGDGHIGRIRFLVGLGAAVLAAAALDALLAPDRTAGSTADRRSWRHRPDAAAVASTVLLVVVVGSCIRYLPDYLDLVRALEDSRAALEPLTGSLVMGGLAVAAVAALALAARRGRLPRIAAVAVIGVIVFLQLTAPLRGLTPEAPVRDFYPELEAHRVLRDLAGDRYRFAASATHFYPNSAPLYDLYDLRGVALHTDGYKALMERASPLSFSRDPLKLIMGTPEWNLASPIYDDVALRYFVQGADEVPIGLTPRVDEGWDRWIPVPPDYRFDLDPVADLAGVVVALRAEGCLGGDVVVRLMQGAETLDEARRPVWTAGGGWLGFGLVGADLDPDVPSTVELTTTAPDCELEVGLGADGRPARWIVVDDPGDAVRLVATEGGWIYERPSARPLVTTYDRWVAMAPDAQLEFLATRSSADRSLAVLDEGAPAQPAATALGELSDVHFGADRVTATVEAAAPTLVSVAQSWTDGWRVTVDGDAADVLRVNGLGLGVVVPAGRHDVRFAYDPASFRVGRALSVVGLVVCGALLASAATRRRRLLPDRRRTSPDAERR